MADTITHILFGESLIKEKNNIEDKEAFTLGCLGPDIFFYYRILSIRNRKNTLLVAKKLHEINITKFIDYSNNYVKKLQNNHIKKSLSDYLKGTVAHFCLDATVHPYINNASQNLPNGHKRYELAIDTILLSKTHNTSSIKYPFRKILKIDKAILKEISKMYKSVLDAMFNIQIPYTMYERGYYDMLKTLRLLQDRLGLKKKLQIAYEKFKNKPNYYRYILYSPFNEIDLDYLNNLKVYGSDTFIDLFNKAINRYLETKINLNESSTISKIFDSKIDYSGNRLEG